MDVIKRNGNIEHFDYGKIQTSIARASDDVREPLNMSDISNLANGSFKNLRAMNKDAVTSESIYQSVFQQMKDNGFSHVAQSYREEQER